MAFAMITSEGRVTIPKHVRERLGLRAGDRVDFAVEEDGSVRLRRVGSDVRELFGTIRADRHVTVEQMDAAIRRRGGEGTR